MNEFDADYIVKTLAHISAQLDRMEKKEHREIVYNFAKIMENKLKQNDYKGGWSNCDIKWLLSRLKEETVELEQAIENKSKENIVKEAADVANFAMMIADNVTRK